LQPYLLGSDMFYIAISDLENHLEGGGGFHLEI